MATSNRETILAEIRRLEQMKAERPSHAHAIDIQITALCDKLKRPSEFKPRKVA